MPGSFNISEIKWNVLFLFLQYTTHGYLNISKCIFYDTSKHYRYIICQIIRIDRYPFSKKKQTVLSVDYWIFSGRQRPGDY